MKAIVRTTLDICAAFEQLSEGTWEEIEQGARTTQFLDEESITNYNLMRLAAAVPAIIVEKHTKKREWRSGADWEMWVGRPGAFLGFRIQAKLLSFTNGRYESLFRSVAKATDQLDKLINAAESAPRRLIPLFAFYNYAPLHVAEFKKLSCKEAQSSSLIVGWTVANAYTIRQFFRTTPTNHLADLAEFMLPIKCLYCCPNACASRSPNDGPEDLATSVAERTRAAWPDAELDPRRVIHQTGPVYIERLYKGERPESGWTLMPQPLRSMFMRERELPRGVSRVLLVRDTPATA